MVTGWLVCKLMIFAFSSAGILCLSWSSLLHPNSHGFFRFFAFESILILILLNLENWFANPFSVLQIISWLLLIASIGLVVHGFHFLREIGKPKGRIENTTNLVVKGAYQYIRHPLYSSLLLLGWGVFFKGPSILTGILVMTASVSLIATAIAEEAENLSKFGSDYAQYQKRTKRFIPFLF